ncbi:hypothetical protein AB0V27_24830, partial [Escherichia coli]
MIGTLVNISKIIIQKRELIWQMSKRDVMGRYKGGFAPIFPDICYHLTHYKPAAADIPVASDNPAHYA